MSVKSSPGPVSTAARTEVTASGSINYAAVAYKSLRSREGADYSGLCNRAQFIRDAILDKLQKSGRKVDRLLAQPPAEVGKRRTVQGLS